MNQTNIPTGKLQSWVNPIWLSFNDSQEQLEYSEREFKQESRMVMHFLLFGCIAAIIMIISWIAFGGDMFTKNLIYNICLAIGFFAGFAIIRWPCIKQFIHYSKLILVLLCSILMIVYEIGVQTSFSSSQNDKKPFVQYEAFQICISFLIIQFGIDLITLFSWKWFISALIHVGHFAFLLQQPLRWDWTGNPDCKTFKFNSILRLFLVFSWIIFLDYASTRMKVSYFNDVFQNKSYLDQFKTFLKELVPIPIIIGNFKKENTMNDQRKFEIKFVNDPLTNLFGKEISTIEDEMQKIQPDSSDFNSKHENKQDESPGKAEINTICSFTDSLQILDGLKNRFENLKLNHFYTAQCKYEKDLGNNKIKIYYFEIKIAKIKWEGNEELALCLHDIGIYKEFDKFKNKLLANVSHNLRTLIHTINANLEMAQELEKCKQIKKLLKYAKQGCFLLINSVNDLLDYSQQCSGNLKINKKWFPLSDVIKDLNHVAKLQAKHKSLAQSFDSKVDLCLFIYNDLDRLKQILLNILNNAVKFTTSGFIKFQVDQENDNSVRKIKFIIKDSGIGISKEQWKDLFVLQQNDRTSNADSQFNIQGVGLGLNISNVLLKLIENTQENILKVESEVGKGTCFSFSVGMNDESSSLQINECNIGNIPKEEIKLPGLENLHHQNQSQKIVLAVDDEPFCLDVVKKLFASQGILQVFSAINGKEAIEIISQCAKKQIFFDVIIMDCDMPLMDGFEATKIIRQMIQEKTIRTLDIVALTANIATADENICRTAGMNYHMKKPVSKVEFFNTLSRIFSLKV